MLAAPEFEVGGRTLRRLQPPDGTPDAMAKPKNACKVCCVPCCMTACFVLVFIPAVVFALSLGFAVVMWTVECGQLEILGNESIIDPGSSYAYNYGDVAIDDTLPDRVPDETDAATLITPSDLLAAEVIDIDRSEAFASMTLTVAGMPATVSEAALALTLPAGAQGTAAHSPPFSKRARGSRE